MKSTDAKSIGEIMAEYLNPAKLDDSINARRFVSHRKLYVQITSAPLRNELMLNRSSLVRRLNEITGADVIDDIIFR